MGFYIYSFVSIASLLILFVYVTYKLFDYKPVMFSFGSLHNKKEDVTHERLKVIKRVLGKDKTLDDLAIISMGCCSRHEADMQSLWFCMDGTEEGLRNWLEEISHCCSRSVITTESTTT